MAGTNGVAADARTAERQLERRVLTLVWVSAAVFLLSVGVINSLSLLTDAARAGHQIDPREPWLLEMSSVTVLAALVPVVYVLERAFPFGAANWRVALPMHVLGSIVFSALHIGGMWLLRAAGYAFWLKRPEGLVFDLGTDLLYEYRKDLLPYAIIVLVLGLQRTIQEQRQQKAGARTEAKETGRVTLRSGGRVFFADATAVDWAEAAGNYVELHSGAQTHLARSTLADLLQQLSAAGADFVQVHRSRIVNRHAIQEILPERDGDYRVRLKTGADVRGSRRYRALLG